MKHISYTNFQSTALDINVYFIIEKAQITIISELKFLFSSNAKHRNNHEQKTATIAPPNFESKYVDSRMLVAIYKLNRITQLNCKFEQTTFLAKCFILSFSDIYFNTPNIL